MSRNQRGFLVLILALTICSVSATVFQPISDSHRSAALELFTSTDGSFGSLEDTYEALRTFEILGINKKDDVAITTCKNFSETLGSSSATSKDLFYAFKVNGVLRCSINEEVIEGIILRSQAAANDASSLLEFYYSVGSLVQIKDQMSKVDLHIADADGVFRSIQALSNSDGRWHYSSDNPEPSTFAAGLALETLAWVVPLASSDIDQSLIRMAKGELVKLFESIEKYDDGAFYFDEKVVDSLEHKGPLSTTSSVVRGLTAFAASTSGSLNLPKDKIIGLAKFFLGIGIPGDAKDLFSQLDSLAFFESNRISIPLILSLPSTVLSLTKNDLLKVRVNTVLGSKAPPLVVKLVRVVSSGAKGASNVESQELQFDSENAVYFATLPESLDVGRYTFSFEMVLHESEHKKLYATGGQAQIPVFITGHIKVENAEIAVLDSDLGSVEARNMLDLSGEDVVSLSANHLQKLRISYQLTTSLGNAFKPHQAVLKLRHESKVEHIFLVENSGTQFEITLDFLGLVEKFFYLSGKYDIQLTVGDAVMENSFLKEVSNVELDLPEAPEKLPQPPQQAVDPLSRYGPKAEINHIFRVPEKLPPKELSLVFSGLIVLPFIGFLIGLLHLGVNLKNFPSSAVPAMFAALFHLGIAGVLLLYVLFWVKLDLFTTLKALGFLGVFLIFVGHRALSHLASTASKLKSA